jgi:hypothetical protein
MPIFALPDCHGYSYVYILPITKQNSSPKIPSKVIVAILTYFRASNKNKYILMQATK